MGGAALVGATLEKADMSGLHNVPPRRRRDFERRGAENATDN
jgi:hypothetical protein